jgi:malonate decarboxylase epsilon subunit
MRLALLFPGQGAQTPGFLGRLPQHPAVAATLSEARQVLGVELAELDSAPALASTASVQLATLIAGVATARALDALGVRADAVAGLSVGAFAAAVSCGMLEFADALRLVRLRGAAMIEAAPEGFGMTAILGLTESRALPLIARVSRDAPLYLASVNARTEIVVSGSEQALGLAAVEAREQGAAVRRLNVSIPSHCPIMDGVSAQLRAALSGLALRPARIPYVSNHRARASREAADIATDLALNVSRTVRWHDSVTLLYELGCRLYIEPPPGQVLSALAAEAFHEARTLALESSSLAGAVTLAQQAAGQ